MTRLDPNHREIEAYALESLLEEELNKLLDLVPPAQQDLAETHRTAIDDRVGQLIELATNPRR